MDDKRVRMLISTVERLDDGGTRHYAQGQVYMVPADQADSWMKGTIAIDANAPFPVDPLQCKHCDAVAETEYLLTKHTESRHPRPKSSNVLTTEPAAERSTSTPIKKAKRPRAGGK